MTLLASPGGYVFAFILGALLGSFANVCILRIPAGKSIVRPGSHCFSCGAPVRFYDNIPLLSWLLLRGRCRSCGVTFSPRYLLIEGVTALLVTAVWALAAARHSELAVFASDFGAHSLYVLALVIIAFIDLDHKQIPDVITLPGIPVFMVLGTICSDRPLVDLVIGVFAGHGIAGLVADYYYFFTKREGLGLGDNKLLSLVGAFTGWQGMIFALFGGSLFGVVIIMPLIVRAIIARIIRWRRRAAPKEGETSVRHLELPYGPFLCAAALAYLFVGDLVKVASGLG